MSNNLPPLLPPVSCPSGDPVGVSTPVLLRSALEGSPNSNPGAGAGLIVDPNSSLFEDNEIIAVARQDGAAGNSISVAVSAPAASPFTTVQISGNAIVIVPGTKGRMQVTMAEDNRFNGLYREAGSLPGSSRPMWVMINGGANPPRLFFPQPNSVSSGKWTFDLSDGVPIYESNDVVYNISTQPESLSFKKVAGGAASTLDVVALVSDAHQGINAVNLHPSASALISVSPAYDGAGSGALAFFPATVLNGGVDPVPGTPALAIGQFSRVGPYVIDPPRTQAYDWFIAETMDSWRQVFE